MNDMREKHHIIIQYILCNGVVLLFGKWEGGTREKRFSL